MENKNSKLHTESALSLIFTCKDQHWEITQLLKYLQEQLSSDDEVIIVDRGSTDATLAFLETYRPQLIFDVIVKQIKTESKDQALGLGQELANNTRILSFGSLKSEIAFSSLSAINPELANLKRIGVVRSEKDKRFDKIELEIFERLEEDFVIFYFNESNWEFKKRDIELCDVIWNNGRLAFTSNLFQYIKSLNIPIITTLKGIFWKERYAQNPDYKNLIKSSIKIITLSSYCKKVLINKFPVIVDKIVVIHNGISIEGKSERLSSSNLLHLLTVTNFAFPAKCEALRDCIKVLTAQGLEFRWDILGKFANSEQAYELQKLWDKTKGIHFHQEIPRENLAKYYRKADIFVYPSYQDCQPRVLFEAMYFGLPIITNDDLSFDEFVTQGENGLIGPIKKFPDFLKCLNQSTSLRENLGKNSRKKIKNVFNWKNTAKQYKRLFLKVLSKDNTIFKFRHDFLKERTKNHSGKPFSIAMLLSRDNQQAFEAIESCLQQNPDEIIFGVDPKLENSDIISYVKNLKNSKVIWQQDSGYIASVTCWLENMLPKASFKWIRHCDDDDQLLGSTADILKFFGRNNIGLIYGDGIRLYQGEKPNEVLLRQQCNNKTKTKLRISGSGSIYNRKMVKKVVNKHLINYKKAFIDIKLAYWALRFGYRILHLPRKLTKINFNENRLTVSARAKATGTFNTQMQRMEGIEL